jgi:hypothetical protein
MQMSLTCKVGEKVKEKPEPGQGSGGGQLPDIIKTRIAG